MTPPTLICIESHRPRAPHLIAALAIAVIAAIPATLGGCVTGTEMPGGDPGGAPGGGAPSGGAPTGGDPGGNPGAGGGTGSASARPIALVYRGPAGCDGCSESVAAVLQSSTWNFDVRYVGPGEALQISAATLATATLYAQPGGTPSVDDAWTMMKADAPAIAAFIQAGGRYLGFCEGGYLAGKTPGFGLLPGDTDQYISSKGASVTTDIDTVIPIVWRGKTRAMYFQDGPFFILDATATAGGATVLATYTNGEIAALAASYGAGKVGVTGPHPEADDQWYKDYKLTDPDGVDADLAHDLIDAVMQ